MSVRDETAARLLHRIARAQVEGRLPSVAAGVVRGGELVWWGGRGDSGGAEPDADTQYRIGSITKTFVAACVMRLRDEGALGLDDVVETHVPGTVFGGARVAELLSHSAGLTSETAGPWWERTPGGDFAQLAAEADESWSKHRAGARFHYSNVGYGVLGELVARLRGRPWEECVHDELLAPLGMTRTTTRPLPGAARGYAVHPWADLLLAEPEHDGGALAPAGQLWSTVADLARWAVVLAGDGSGVLAPDTVGEMRAPVVVDSRPDGWFGHGLGPQVWPVTRPDGTRGTHVGHGGSMPGFLAGLRADPSSGDAAVVFANATSGLAAAVDADLLALLAQNEPLLPEPWRPSSVGEGVEELLGPWYWGPSSLAVRADAEGFTLGGLGGRARTSRFRPDGEGGFVGLDGYYAGETLRVVRRDAGSVDHLDLASFVITRAPYDPETAVPGGVDPAGWHAPGD